MDETVVAHSRNPVDSTRDLIRERSEELTEKSAKRLFELPYSQRGRLDDFDAPARELMFSLALAEAGTSKGHPLWSVAFNSYAALQELVRVVRIPGTFTEGSAGQYAQTVMSSHNRLGTVFSLLRKHKDMSDEEARQLLELAHSTALAGLSTDARKAIYSYAADRAVTKLELANQYSEIVDLVVRVKRNPYPEL